MKFTLFFFTLLIFGACASPKAYLIDKDCPEVLEPGKCYSSVKSDTLRDKGYQTFQEGFVLRITQPIFKKKKRKISKEVADLYKTRGNHYRFPYRSFCLKYTILNDELEYEHSGDWDAGIIFCLPEVPPTYKTVTLEILEKQNFEIEFLELIQPSKLEKIFVKKKPKKLKPNEWYFKPGYWYELRHYLSTHGSFTYQYFEQKLKEAGYEIHFDGNIDEKELAALIDFQKKNGIQKSFHGVLWDKETLRKLGVYTKRGTIKNMPYYEPPEKAFIVKDF